jgi:PAS domain S-box-containing protein
MFHPDDQDKAWATWRHSLQTGEPYQIEYRLRHHTGQYRWTLGRALPIKDEDGNIVRWIGTCTDIHESRLAAEERELVAQELSHRIKNIFAVLTGIIGH